MSSPFKITIVTNEGDISFGRRIPGQIGKDILAVKLALGVIKDSQGLLEIANHPANEIIQTIPQDDYGWFDCVTGSRLTLEQAATFDQKTEIALINYQTSNQFFILSYLFQKYGAAKIIADSVDLEDSEEDRDATLIESVFREHKATKELFDRELGIIGEATLAIMHGWLPYTRIKNKGYYHDINNYNPSRSDYVYDIITPELRSDFASGRLGQSPDSLEDYGPGLQLTIGDPRALDIFLNQVPEDQKWIPGDSTSGFGTVLYNIKLQEGSDSPSLLYKSAATSIINYNTRELNTARALTEEELARRSAEMYYPNPFSTKDPFYISEVKEGFYMETDFVLSPEGPVPNNQEETIIDLEEKALEKIIDYYNKPKIWFLLKNDEFIEIKYFGAQTPPATSHVGYLPQEYTESEKQLIPKFRLIKSNIDFIKSVIDTEFEMWRVRDALAQRGPRRADGTYDPGSLAMLSDNEPPGWRVDLPAAIGVLGDSEGQIQLLQRWEYWNGRLFAERAKYNEIMSREDNQKYFYVVGTEEGKEILTDEENTVYVDSWRLLEGYGRTDPLIKFVEYKTPSFRPGQKYVAFFEINKEKLDLIVNGYRTPAPQAEEEEGGGRGTVTADVPGCSSNSAEESKRLIEEQRNHAKSRRRHMVRQIRERLAKEEEFHRNPSVDLGEYGPFDLNAALGSLLGSAGSGMSDYEYSKLVLSTLGETGEMIIGSIPGINDIDQFNSMSNDFSQEISALQAAKGTDKEKEIKALEIDLEQLKLRIETAIKDLRDSEGILSNEGITYMKGSNFSATKESNLLNQFYTDVHDLAIKGIEENTRALTKAEQQQSNRSADAFKKHFVSYAEQNLDEVVLLITFEISDETKGTSQLGPLVGSKIKQLTIQYPSPPPTKVSSNAIALFEDDINNVQSEALQRPRTVHYIRNIKEMTGLLTSRPNSIKPFLGDARGSCAELGVNLEKRQAASFIASYTTGVKANPSKKNPIEEAFTSIWKENFKEPAIEWWEQSKANARETIDTSNFDQNQALRQFGELCTLEELYVEFFSKLSLPSLFCDWLKCIRFPGFNLKLPSFFFPPLPSIPIIGWYGGLKDFFEQQWLNILKRLACTIAKILIDKLAMPFCQEQLEEFLAAGLSTTQPYLREAIIDSIRETGIAEGKEEDAKKLFEDVSNICTPNEFCDLLEGRSLDSAAMQMVERLVEKNQLNQDLYSQDAIVNYFGVIGTFMPFDLCQQIRRVQPSTPPKNCIELNSYLTNIRNRMTTGDSTVTDAEIEEVVNIAKEENEKLEEQLNAFSGGNIGDGLPPAYEPGNPAAVVSDYPDWMKDQMNRTIASCFSESKSGYQRSLRTYVPNMSVEMPVIPRAGDDFYQDIEAMRLEAAVAQLSMYQASLESGPKLARQMRASSFGEYLEIFERIGFGEVVSRAELHLQDIREFYLTINEHERLMKKLRHPEVRADRNQRFTNKKRVEEWAAEGRDRKLLRVGGEFDENPNNESFRDDREPPYENFPAGNWLESLRLIELGHGRLVPGTSDGALEFYRELPRGRETYTNKFVQFRDLLRKATDIIRRSTVLSTPDLRVYTDFQEVEDPDTGQTRVEQVQTEYYFLDRLVTPLDLVREGEYQSERLRDFDMEVVRYFLANGYTMYEDQDIINEDVQLIQATEDLTKVKITGTKAMLLWTAFEYETITKTDADGNTRTHFVHKKYKVKPDIPERESFVAALDFSTTHQPKRQEQLSRLISPLQTVSVTGHIIAPEGLAEQIEYTETQQGDDKFEIHPDDKYLYGVFPDPLKPQEDYYESVSYDTFHELMTDPENKDEFVLKAVDRSVYWDAYMSFIYGLLPDGINTADEDAATTYLNSWLNWNNDMYGEGDTKKYYTTNVRKDHLPEDIRYLTERVSNFSNGGITDLITSPNGPLPCLTPEDGGRPELLDGTMLVKNAFHTTRLTMKKALPNGKQEDRLIKDFMIQVISASPNSLEILEVVNDRINELTTTITEVFERRPELSTQEHLKVLRKIYATQNFVRTENIIVEPSGEEGIQLSLGLGVYAPKIKIADIPAGRRQDRFDVEITSDLHLRQIGEYDKKLFRLCDGLPEGLVQYNDEHNEPYFSKREAFAKMVARNSEGSAERLGINLSALEGQTFLSIRESIIKYTFEQLKESRLFDVEYANEVHDRVAGRPDYSRGDCVTNRQGLVDASILAFNDTILKGGYQEFMNEISKPENSPFERDFDDISPIEIAIQNMAFKAFVRVCLIDTMLKGGLAYSVWDIEPVISSTMFVEYAFEHVRVELERNRLAGDLWKKIAERTMEIGNGLVALRSLVVKEMQELPDLSKQIFSPNRRDYDYYNWFVESAIPEVPLSPEIGAPSDEIYSNDIVADIFPLHSHLASNRGVTSNFVAGQDSFYRQGYISIEGPLGASLVDTLRGLGTRAGYTINQGNRLAISIDRGFLPLGQDSKVLLSVPQFEELIRTLKDATDRAGLEAILSDLTIKYGKRIMLALRPSSDGDLLPHEYATFFANRDEILRKSNLEGTDYTLITLNQLSEDSGNIGIISYLMKIIPILSCETDIGPENCPNIYFGNPEDIGVITQQVKDYTFDCLKSDPEFEYLFENIFNIRRYLSIFSMFATATMQGYNGMVGLFESVKSSLGFLMKLASTPASEQFQTLPMSVHDFENLMNENFPVDPDDAGCFGIPNPDFEEFLKEFYKTLKKLIEELPSIFFRGVAAVLDPAYKEMRQHYYNCDIKALNHSGVDYQADGADSELINGLLLRAQNHGEQNGKYVPLESFFIDLAYGIRTWSGSRIGKSILKLVTYAYSGKAPFLDPSGFFTIPCNPKLDSNWLKDEKYDMGAYGRYGQPTSIFTHLALMTKQLQRDIDIKNRSCRIVNDEPLPIDECTD